MGLLVELPLGFVLLGNRFSGGLLDLFEIAPGLLQLAGQLEGGLLLIPELFRVDREFILQV